MDECGQSLGGQTGDGNPEIRASLDDIPRLLADLKSLTYEHVGRWAQI